MDETRAHMPVAVCSTCGYHFVPMGPPPGACQVCNLLAQTHALLNHGNLEAPERQALVAILAGLHRLLEAAVAVEFDE